MSLSALTPCVRFLQVAPIGLLAPCVNKATTNLQFVRYVMSNKHWKPEFKWLRRKKVIKVDLPNFNEKDAADMTDEEIRSKMKEKGLLPPRPWFERQIYISATGAIFEPYVPPEGDGKVSSITMHGAKQRVQFIEKKSKSMMAIRKIKSFDEDFETSDFVQAAQDIYINAHTCMANKDRIKIQQYVTERAYPEIIHNTRDKTIHWKFIKSLEPPRVVHARCTDLISKENMFAQITVRFHTQQILAVYDRFGRLMHGSEILAKDVLEYIVFEKHISNEYGIWRLHDKIVPDWMPPKEPIAKTSVTKKTEKVEQESEDKEVQTTSKNEDKEAQVATA